MVFYFSSSLFSSFSSILDLHITIVATFLITTFFIAALSYLVASYYMQESIHDSLFIILFSLAIIVFCVGLWRTPNIIVAACAGILSGELLGLFIHDSLCFLSLKFPKQKHIKTRKKLK